MEIDRINPVIIGVLRATPADTPLLIRKSDRKPDNRTPMNAARNGSEARKPDWRKSRPLYFTRYVGNHVRKNHKVELTANCPIYIPHSLR